MGISIPGKDGLYIERGPWFLLFSLFSFSPYYPMIILNLVILFFSDSAWLDPWFCCDSGWTRCSLFVWREPEKSSFNWVPGVFAWLVHSHWLECSLRVLHVLDVATRVIIYLTHLPLDKMAAISWMIFSNVFSCMKSFVFRFEFHWRFVPKDPINNKPALVLVMAWHQTVDKSLPEPILTLLYAAIRGDELTHCGLVAWISPYLNYCWSSSETHKN